MSVTFKDLGVSDFFTNHLKLKDIITPTPIQELVIPKILEGETPLILSNTGSGKSLAYLLPLLQRLKLDSGRVEMLILVPTRELAQQVGATIDMLYGEEGVSYAAVIHGSVAYEAQIELLKAKPSIIVATVGRLKDLMAQGELSIDGVGAFVLDEVDQMLDMGFGDDVVSLARCRRSDCCSCFVSATMNDKIFEIISSIDSRVECMEIVSNSKIVSEVVQRAYYCEKNYMDNLLIHILRKRESGATIVFTRSRSMADRLAEVITANGLVAEAFHSERSQKARDYILERFRSGETPIIVATDVMARGVDIENIAYVINYGLPLNADLYIHRIGRTARAGRFGTALTICEPNDMDLLMSIQKSIRKTIEVDNSHPFYTSSVTKMLVGLGKGRKKKIR